MSSASAWRISATRAFALDRPRLLAIINTTPDSFSDGELALKPTDAADHAARFVDEGADALDIGAESTRPGAEPVSTSEQIDRAIPAIRAIREQGIDLPITIDTTSAEVAAAALDAGADAINDVSGATADPGMLALAAERDCSIILMHRFAAPGEDSYSDAYETPPDYETSGGVVEAVAGYLVERAHAAQAAGVHSDGIVLDPGLGFGKSVEQNVRLMRGMPRFLGLGTPVLAGASRKSFIGALTGEQSPERRVFGSVAAAVTMAASGVRLFRVHDVAAHSRALRVAKAIGDAEKPVME